MVMAGEYARSRAKVLRLGKLDELRSKAAFKLVVVKRNVAEIPMRLVKGWEGTLEHVVAQINIVDFLHAGDHLLRNDAREGVARELEEAELAQARHLDRNRAVKPGVVRLETDELHGVGNLGRNLGVEVEHAEIQVLQVQSLREDARRDGSLDVVYAEGDGFEFWLGSGRARNGASEEVVGHRDGFHVLGRKDGRRKRAGELVV
mmetsp:Transcript_7012/g.23265  ORF Transcript_7012/g.23265 Transcript_7012/m.23265 type:complete len:204 (-) Transcript_7012:671-1282(-)